MIHLFKNIIFKCQANFNFMPGKEPLNVLKSRIKAWPGPCLPDALNRRLPAVDVVNKAIN